MSVLAEPRIRGGRPTWLAYGLAVAVIALDQLSKAWVLGGLHLADRGSTPVLPPLLRFSLVWNRGFSFGLLSGTGLARWGLFVFSVAVALGLMVVARRLRRALPAVALGLIIGGALGNAMDRVRFGAVVDFIDVSAIGVFPWIFNVADSAITCGVILLLVDSLVAGQTSRERR
jgi:signal peptidase II